MNVQYRGINYADERGSITDLIDGAAINHVALFRSVAGSVRGNHYHLQSWAYVYVLSGLLDYRWRGEEGPTSRRIIQPGELITIPPLERHSLSMIEDTVFLMMTAGPSGGRQYENDTVREAV